MAERKEQKKGSAFGKAQREKLIKAAGGKCEGCGAELPRRDQTNQGKPALEVHHIRPRSQGGSNGNRNGAVLCNPHGCHDDANELALKYHVPFSEVKDKMGETPFKGYRRRRVQRAEKRSPIRHVLRRLRGS